jgi:hypothetical protein
VADVIAAAKIIYYGGVNMERKRNWLGWIAIGLGVVALAVALLGRGFGAQMAYPMQQSPIAQQQNAGPQNGPGANAQPGAGRRNAGPQNGPGANAQPGAGRQGMGQPNGSNGPAAGMARRDGGRPGQGGFGIGGLLRMPFRLIGGSFQWAMLALLIGLGVWMIRGRNHAAAAASGRAEPAQPAAPLSPTGEAYTEEESEE